MKKIISLTLVLIMIVLLAACGAEKSSESDSVIQVEESSAQVEFCSDGVIEDTVLYDENNIKITATALNYYENALSVDLIIENNGTQAVSVVSNVISYSCNYINDCMISDGYINCDIEPGKKCSQSMRFEYDALMLAGITEVAEMGLAFRIEPESGDSIYTGPLNLKTSLAANYKNDSNVYTDAINSKALQSYLGYSVVMCENESVDLKSGVSIISEALIHITDSDEEGLLLEIENTSDKTVYAIADKIAINGYTVCSSSWTSECIAPQKRAIVSIKINSVIDYEIMEGFDIGEISKIGITFETKDEDGNALSETPITISIPGRKDNSSLNGKEVFSDEYVKISSISLEENEDDIVLILGIENLGDKEIKAEAMDASISINDYMIDSGLSYAYIEPGKSALLSIEMDKDDLSSSGINSKDDIKSIEITLPFENEHYDTVTEPTFNIKL